MCTGARGTTGLPAPHGLRMGPPASAAAQGPEKGEPAATAGSPSPPGMAIASAVLPDQGIELVLSPPCPAASGKRRPTRGRQRGTCTEARRPPRYAPGVRGAAEIPVPRKPAAASPRPSRPGSKEGGAVATAGPRCEKQRVPAPPSPRRRSPPHADPGEGALQKAGAQRGHPLVSRPAVPLSWPGSR